VPLDSSRHPNVWSDEIAAWPPAQRPRLRRQTTAEAVAEFLRQRVFDGGLRPGDRINVDALAVELGVSRVPVREALIGMARDGLVVMPPHQGVYVGDFDPGVLRDHFEIVGMIQGMAAAHLVEATQAPIIERLGEIVSRLEGTSDVAEVHALGTEFHRIINHEGATSRERSVLRALGRMLPTGFILQIQGGAQLTRKGTPQIYSAIQTGDPDETRRACRDVQSGRAELVIARMKSTDSLTRMPPIGVRIPDEKGIALVSQSLERRTP